MFLLLSQGNSWGVGVASFDLKMFFVIKFTRL